jgi:hypothetical protein
MAKCHEADDVGTLVDKTLQEMRENNMYPDTECYRAAIIAWKNSASKRDSNNTEECIFRAQQLFQEMSEEFHRTTVVTVQPSTEDYNHVLEALAFSKSPRAFANAEKLFYRLKESAHLSGGPDPTSYRFLMSTLCNRRFPDKLSRASKVLKDLLQKTRENVDWVKDAAFKASLVDAFSAFIRVCGTAGSPDKTDGTRIMTIALRCLEEMKVLGLTPDSGSYTALIEACDHLLPLDGQERQDVLERIFRRACYEGYVDAALLAQFRASATEYLYTNIVVANGTTVEEVRAVPQSWTRNVPGYKEGRKNIPLSIQGTYSFTKAAAEYQARNLRRRKNQRILQGGRLK